MFELMHKYRVAILAMLFVGLFGWGAWSAIQMLFERGPKDMLIGAYRLPGEKEDRKVFLSEFEEVREHIRMNYGDLERFKSILMLGDKDPSQIIWDFIVLRAAARKAGIVIADKQVIPERPDGKPVRLADSTIQFLKDVNAVYMFRLQYFQDPGGPGYKEVWERYKTDNEELRGRAVVFARKELSEFPFDKAKPEDVKKLEDWWETRKYLGSQKQVPEKLDLEVAYVRFKDKTFAECAQEFEQNWAEATAGIEVKDEEIQARWNAFGSQYEGFLDREMAATRKAQEEENKKAKEEGREPKNLTAGDQPSKFDRTKEQLRREIKIGKLLTRILDDVKASKVLKDLCAAAKISCVPLEKKSLDDLQDQPEFGNGRVKQHLMLAKQRIAEKKLAEGQIFEYESTTTSYLPRIFDEPAAFQALYRIITVHAARPSELKEVLDWAIEQWQKEQADNEVRDRAKAFRDAVDARVEQLDAVKTVREQAQKERDEAVDKELKDASLSREKPEDKPRIDAIENRLNKVRDDKLAEEKKKHETEAYLAVAKDQGLEVQDLGWMRKSSAAAMNYQSASTPEEKLNRYLRSSGVIYGLAGLEAGRVGQPQPDVQAGLTAVLVLDEKRSPAEEEMLLRPDKVRNIAMQLSQRPGYDEWQYKNFRNESWFALHAWETEKAIRDSEERDAKRKARAELDQRRRAEEAFRRQAATIEDKRKKEAENPPPPPPAPAPGEAPKAPGDQPAPQK